MQRRRNCWHKLNFAAQTQILVRVKGCLVGTKVAHPALQLGEQHQLMAGKL